MSEPNESRRDDKPTDDAGSSPFPSAENQRTPDIVDAEIVDETIDAPEQSASATGTPGSSASGTAETTSSTPQDDEEFRQYQQFLEFQKFRQWQRQHSDSSAGLGDSTGGTTTDAPRTTTTSKPWWHYAVKALRFRPVRWLIYLIVAYILLNTLISNFFGDSQNGGSTNTGTQGSTATTPTTPKNTFIALYKDLSFKPHKVCQFMTDTGRSQFARANNAPDCGTASHALHAQVTDPEAYSHPNFGETAITQIPGQAKVLSCEITAEGGPKLGTFRLAQQPNQEWLIDRYSSQCPA